MLGVEIKERINELHTISPIAGERQDAVDYVLATISRLTQDVADAASYIPAYDHRGYTASLKTLSEMLKEEQAKFAPKTRFQFKPRTTQSTLDPKQDTRRNVPVEDVSHTPKIVSPRGSEANDTVHNLSSISERNYDQEIENTEGIRKPSFSAAQEITISDHKKLHIILPPSASRATSSGILAQLEDCIVDMSLPTTSTGISFTGLVLKSISGSLIVAGHVNGSALITGVRGSILVVVARQVRMHQCENVDLYTHTLTDPIIEDCKRMRFAPAPECYVRPSSEGNTVYFADNMAQLTEKDKSETNMWNKVKDFMWLKEAESSPNWSVLPEDERIALDVWKDVVPGVPGLSAEDILKRVGVKSEELS